MIHQTRNHFLTVIGSGVTIDVTGGPSEAQCSYNASAFEESQGSKQSGVPGRATENCDVALSLPHHHCSLKSGRAHYRRSRAFSRSNNLSVTGIKTLGTKTQAA